MIYNETKKEVIVSNHKLLTNIFAMAFGLMFRNKIIDSGWVFILPKSSSWDVTNLFVFQDIDVLWLSNDKVVLKKETVKSWKIHVQGIPKTRFLIELPAGKSFNVSVGDKITWN